MKSFKELAAKQRTLMTPQQITEADRRQEIRTKRTNRMKDASDEELIEIAEHNLKDCFTTYNDSDLVSNAYMHFWIIPELIKRVKDNANL